MASSRARPAMVAFRVARELLGQRLGGRSVAVRERRVEPTPFADCEQRRAVARGDTQARADAILALGLPFQLHAGEVVEQLAVVGLAPPLREQPARVAAHEVVCVGA